MLTFGMMENKKIARTLRLLSQLMELHDENPFKVKSIANAAFKVDKLPFKAADKSLEELEKIDGIGKSTASKIWELLDTGILTELAALIDKTPLGIVDMLSIKGLGPKKIVVIWKDLDIENIGELYYACNENRLVEAKGFGLKTQEEIKKAIEFMMASNGRFIYAHVEAFAENLLSTLINTTDSKLTSFTGEYRRKAEIIDKLELLIGDIPVDIIAQALEANNIQITDHSYQKLEAENADGIKITINFCTPADYYPELVWQTGSEEHVAVLKSRLPAALPSFRSEEEVYKAAGLDFIEPELRENTIEFSGPLPKLITYADLKGTLHNHSTWSDGVHTLEEMALFCKDELKLQYLGMCDHSRSAFYANGLDETRVAAQHHEIDELNKKLAPFRIFKGIESDILYDGSLDYPAEILASFDFIVASVHSILKMDEEKATSRLIKAIENPYTTILGHPTGRLLLSRGGYPIDHAKVIDACAANGVAIEINANPLRLDLDWRWHHYAIQKGIKLCINPDAHRKEGFYDMHFGTLAARKGGVSVPDCLNAMNLDEISAHFKAKKPA